MAASQIPAELDRYPDIRSSQEMLFKMRQSSMNEESRLCTSHWY